ncbi:unnamed protein product [Hydatigera taeniaeformis]|uniref:Uncharacterized protein n=1 Tax=Hydatigena taeniaeformis TaxID=6205 RepID=A0A0R3WZE9_HYDTA|nr:unnamed protein product [Hydatigera taeniaeformis]
MKEQQQPPYQPPRGRQWLHALPQCLEAMVPPVVCIGATDEHSFVSDPHEADCAHHHRIGSVTSTIHMAGRVDG